MVSADRPAASTARVRALLVGVAVVTFVAAVSALGARATYGARTTADEPQYLLTAISLGEDLDLDISDELAARRYLPFHEVPVDQQTRPLDDAGQRLSPHDPLLPAILALPMRIGGWELAKTSLAAIAAITAALTAWVAIRRFGASAGPAASVVGVCFVTPPLTAYATQVYPELPAALCVVVAVAALTGPVRARSVAAFSLAVVALPWLAVKYVPVVLVLAVAGARWLWRGDRRLAAAVGLAASLMAIAYAVFHRLVYGGWTVYAAGDHFVGGELDVVGRHPDHLGRSRRVVGLLVDRGFGLVAWMPVYLLAVPSLVAVVRARHGGRWLVVATVAAGWAMATWVALTMHGWWWPGRQVVVVVPLLVIAICLLVDRFAWLLRPTLIVGIAAAVNWWWLVFEASTGRRTLIVDFLDTSSPAYRWWSVVLPDHREPGSVDVVLTLAWMAVIAIGSAAAWRSISPHGQPPETGAPTSAEREGATPVADAQPAAEVAGTPSVVERVGPGTVR